MGITVIHGNEVYINYINGYYWKPWCVVIVQDDVVKISDDNKLSDNALELTANADDHLTVVENNNEQVENIATDNEDTSAPTIIPGNDLCLPVISSLCSCIYFSAHPSWVRDYFKLVTKDFL